jgi:hypothetical protein
MNNLTGALQRRLFELQEELIHQERKRLEIVKLQAGQADTIYLYGRVEHRVRWMAANMASISFFGLTPAMTARAALKAS